MKIAAMLAAAMTVAISSAQAPGQARPVTESDVVRLAMERNPGLAAAVLEVKRSDQAVLDEQERYQFVLTADTGISRNPVPGLSLLSSDTTTSPTTSYSLGAGVTRPFPTGTEVSLGVEGTAASRAWAMPSAATETASTGPVYGLTGRLGLTQPLWRNYGTTVGGSGLRRARLSRTAARHHAHQVASELLRDVLTAYWELWYSTSALAIREQARDLASRELAEIQGRIARGAVAPVEALAFETTLASRDEEVVQARDDLDRRALELSRLLGEPGSVAGGAPSGGFVAADSEPGPLAAPMDAGGAASQADAGSYQVRELSARVDVAREEALVAGESLRPRLDIQAWVEGQGLDSGSTAQSMDQAGTARTGGAFVGLTFEMPMTAARRRAQQALAALTAEKAARDLEAGRRQVVAEAAMHASSWRAATQRLELARRTAELAAKQAVAERRRYEVGTAIALQVRQAEDALLQARLRVTRAQVDQVLAELAVAHLTGTLLRRHAAFTGAGGEGTTLP
jgi:outer membrane protein TolC